MSIAMFERFEIEMSMDQALSVSVPGQDAENAVNEVLRDPKIIAQLDAIGFASIRDELREYGAWDDDELADDADNQQRIIWIAGGDIRDDFS